MSVLRRRLPLLQFVRYNSCVAELMEDCLIVPDVIDVAPQIKAEVVFDQKYRAELGNKLKPAFVKNPPKISWKGDQNAFHTLCMTDPDAPSPSKPVLREWHHWLIGNIPGMNVQKGEVLSEYIGAAPPKKSGFHRYVILIFKQPDALKFFLPRLTNKSAEKREAFSIRAFAQKYRLGNPVAGNFFLAAWDEYVPILYKKLESG